MAKYKIGDRVRIKKNLVHGKEYNDNVSFWDFMYAPFPKYKGKIVDYVINFMTGKIMGYKLKGSIYTWTDDMLDAYIKPRRINPNKKRINIRKILNYEIDKLLKDTYEIECIQGEINPVDDEVTITIEFKKLKTLTAVNGTDCNCIGCS